MIGYSYIEFSAILQMRDVLRSKFQLATYCVGSPLCDDGFTFFTLSQ